MSFLRFRPFPFLRVGHGLHGFSFHILYACRSADRVSKNLLLFQAPVVPSREHSPSLGCPRILFSIFVGNITAWLPFLTAALSQNGQMNKDFGLA